MRSRRLWFVFAIVLIPAAIWGQTLLGGNRRRPPLPIVGDRQLPLLENNKQFM